MRRASRVLGLAAVLAGLCAGTARADKPDGATSSPTPLKADARISVEAKVDPAQAPRAQKQEPAPDPKPGEPSVPHFMPPPPALPDTGSFDGMLFDLARPLDGKPRGFTTSSFSVAFSGDAPMLAPPAKAGEVSLLRAPALNATVGSVPAGASVFGFLAPDQMDVSSLKLRDVGKLVAAPNGLIQRTSRRLLGTGTFRDVVLDGLGSVVTTALIARMGTARTQGLIGFDPGTNFKLFGNRLNQHVGFHCDPKFKNAGIDLGSQFHLLHVTAPSLTPFLTDTYLEGGVTVQRGMGPGILPVRWGKLHLVNGHLDGGVGIYDPPNGPPSLTLDGVATAGRYRLHFQVARETGTGNLGATTTLITTAGPFQTGVFFGGRDTAPTAADRGFTTGVIAMSVF